MNETCDVCENELEDNGYGELWCPDCDSQRLSVYDAADIYMCSGFDEDRRSGYSHEELLEALK